MSRGACRRVRRATGDVVSLRRVITAFGVEQMPHHREGLAHAWALDWLRLLADTRDEVVIEFAARASKS
jgi:hypothetical protein